MFEELCLDNIEFKKHLYKKRMDDEFNDRFTI